MVGPASGFKIHAITRTNDGTSSDLSQSLAQVPGWFHGVECFNVSSNQLAHIFLYDSSGAITTASVPFWHGVIPFYGSLSSGSLTDVPGGAGFAWTLNDPIPLDHGLGYAISGSLAATALSTIAGSLIVTNLQFQTSTAD